MSESQLREVEIQIYGEIDNQIVAVRQQEENAIAASNQWVRQLAEIRYMKKATEDSIV